MNAQTTPPSRPRTGPSAATLPSLTGIRAAAALLVFGLHLRNLGYLNPSADSIASWAFNAGTTGVSLFFVLSGFLITGLLLGEGERGRINLIAFWGRRARRLLPALHRVAMISRSSASAAGSAGTARCPRNRTRNSRRVWAAAIRHSRDSRGKTGRRRSAWSR